jgi:hypothetical protein
MRQETNNEMDLLLRRLARQQETSASGDHLDADELNSYAENALPPAARARYSEHLAECGRCRDLVVQLSSSAGAVVAQETAKVFAPSALQKFLASLLSPMVLRYAVPALGLVIVAAIGFMVSRNDGTSNSPIADVRYKQQDQAPVAASQPQQPSVSPEKQSSAFYDRGESANKAVTPHESAAQSGAAASNAPPVTTDVPKDTETQAKKVEEQQQPETKEAEPPKPAAAVSDVKKLEPQARTQQAAEQTVTVGSNRDAEKAKTDDRSGVADFAVSGGGLAKKRAEAGSAGRAAAAKPMSAERDDAADKDKNDAETRTVAGRRFRKQGGVWIDTAYNSQSLTEIRRGSEQYRGLVGDEPEIRQIASQLDGEIIVVWKGKAYKIR